MRENSYARDIRNLAAEVGFHDQEHRGELAQIFDGPGRRRRYLRRDGVSLDDFGELLLDRGLTARRFTPDEVWSLLSQTFDGRGDEGRGKPRRRSTREAVGEIESDAEKAKKSSRLLKSVCSECGAIGYSSAIVALEHCGRRMERVGRTFAEVMAQVRASEAVPF